MSCLIVVLVEDVVINIVIVISFVCCSSIDVAVRQMLSGDSREVVPEEKKPVGPILSDAIRLAPV